MAKKRSRYVCSNCNRVTAAYVGRCPKCGEFDTMVEEVLVEAAPASKRNRRAVGASDSQPQRLADVTADGFDRLPLPLPEFGRVLGGGIVPGSLVLVGGDPGIGKSTLLLDVSALAANAHGTTLYVSGEESSRQIKMRADRLGITADDLYLVTETKLQAILNHVDTLRPTLVIVDSIQTTFAEDLTSAAGSVSQVRECASRFQELAKTSGISIFLVGHVTKEGTIAGPRVLEHIVDTVLYLGRRPVPPLSPAAQRKKSLWGNQ